MSIFTTPNTMNKLDIYLSLFKSHHILHFNRKLVITNKFFRDFSMEKMQQHIDMRRKEEKETHIEKAVPAVSFNFKKFILDAEIPEKLSLSNGSFYWANRYSEKANKAFQKLMKRPEMNYDILVVATRLYYKSGGARVTIANYILEGVWESFYDAMIINLEKGTAEKHIKKSLQEGDEGFSRYN